MITPLVGLTIIIAGVVVLEAAAPLVDVTGRSVVDDLPSLILEDSPTCTRQSDDTTAEDIRGRFVPGGRVSSGQIFRCPAALDGMEVSYAGEVVGDILERSGGAWVQVNDDTYALEVGPLVGHRAQNGFNTGLTVWLPDGMHERIGGVGRPAQRGDVILVKGTLLRTDPEDGGGLTIRADEMEIIADTLTIENPLHVPQLIAAIVLALLATGAMIWSRIVARRL